MDCSHKNKNGIGLSHVRYDEPLLINLTAGAIPECRIGDLKQYSFPGLHKLARAQRMLIG